MARRLLSGTLQNGAHGSVLVGRDAPKEAKTAKQRFIRAQLVGRPVAQRLAHAVRQNAVHVGDGGDDARGEIVLQREDLV